LNQGGAKYENKDLFSEREIRRKVKEAVDSVIEHLEGLDAKENEN